MCAVVVVVAVAVGVCAHSSGFVDVQVICDGSRRVYPPACEAHTVCKLRLASDAQVRLYTCTCTQIHTYTYAHT
jgi:hypothetical protein